MRSFLTLAVVLIGFISCDSNQCFDEYQSVDDSVWLKNNIVKFDVEISDTISLNNVFINIRNNKDYEFSNLFLIAKMEFPNGTSIVDTLEYEMTDKHGKFLGSGFTDIKENKLFYKENVRFPSKGLHILKVEQAMRKNSNIFGLDSLKGITDIGIRIETINE